ncbi:MAG: hypothetical protein F4X57_08080 [Chloroflexi bacterium]|nr:hypothetical protein [Chloroflexota bacterium]
MNEKPRKITNAWVNRTLPDIFYETPQEAVERVLAEREAIAAAEARADREREARLAAEARERELLEEIESLRRRISE